ncbi:MAG: serine hydrolase domain-containing protein [Cyclobacteriaceae bacterium]
MNLRKVYLPILFFDCVITSFAQPNFDLLDQELKSLNDQKYLPGFAVAIVNADGILYKNSYGFANLKQQRPFTDSTSQIIASVSKTLIAFDLMKLVEQGKLSLDTPVNDILPFDVVNPNYPNLPITINHLVTHTSGILDLNENYDHINKRWSSGNKSTIKDAPKDYRALLKRWKRIKPSTLAKFCESTLSESGKWYTKKAFANNPPGSKYEYSNLGATLAGYIVEVSSGKKFETYTEENLLAPLQMNQSNWHVSEIDASKLASRYVLPQMYSMPNFDELSFPDGGFYTSLNDLSKYLIEMIKGYSGKSDLLMPELFKIMMTPRLTEEQLSDDKPRNMENLGVFWHIAPNGDIWHNGGEPTGATVYMWFDPESGIGRILMTNYFVAERESQIEFISIWRALEKSAGQIQSR